MKKHLFLRPTLFTFAVFLIVLGGCASTGTSRFYSLNSMQAVETVQKSEGAAPGVSIGIGPIDIPDYLHRPQIVTRTGQNELKIAEFDRWVGSLEADVSRVLVENLSILLAEDRISVFPWKQPVPMDYVVAVDILRLDGKPGGQVVLKARWTIHGKKDKKMVLARETNIGEDMEGYDYNTMVAAMSRALVNLSREIATELRSLSQGMPDQ